jgi:predicted hydrolase (HD superfamily)
LIALRVKEKRRNSAQSPKKPGKTVSGSRPKAFGSKSRREMAENGCMTASLFTREAAWQLVVEYTESPSLRKHALSVETCVRAYGEREADALGLRGDDRDAFVEKYAITGVLHDFDYERFPSLDDHPFAGSKILAELGWPEEIRTAILSHASYSGVPRDSHLEKALFACDELAGFLTACSLVKPTKSIFDVDVAGVRKKMKDKAFAKGVHREDIVQGAAALGVELDAHIAFCIEAMRKNAEALELKGTAAGM